MHLEGPAVGLFEGFAALRERRVHISSRLHSRALREAFRILQIIVNGVGIGGHLRFRGRPGDLERLGGLDRSPFGLRHNADEAAFMYNFNYARNVLDRVFVDAGRLRA